MKLKYKCPCCGYYTFENKPVGDYDICPVCYWEDDYTQNMDEDFCSGPNHVSLRMARLNFKEFGACVEDMIKHTREPYLDEKYGIEYVVNSKDSAVENSRVILASASPRRKELLQNILNEFEIIPSMADENIHFTNPEEYVQSLAFVKAKEVYEKVVEPDDSSGKTSVIGADTIVFLDGKVLGKPKDEEDAFNMIKSLSENVHSVYTGICILSSDGRIIKNSRKTDVYIGKISDDEICDYVKSGDPMDKAGAYGIQGQFSKYISKIDGDYFNVVGLPVNCLYEELKKI